MARQTVPRVSSSTMVQHQRLTTPPLGRSNILTAAFILVALLCAITPAEAQTTTAATTTKVTVNGRVFYVLVPTDLGQTVTLPSVRSDASVLGGIAVLGATIDVDEGGNSNVGGGTIDKPASGNGASSRSLSLTSALSATFVGLVWAVANMGLI